MEIHTNNDAYAKHNPTAIIFTEMALILVSGLEMTVSRCEIIISLFAITISHLEINFTTPCGINPPAAATNPHNSATIPRNSTIKPHNSATIPRATSRLGVITPMPLPCPTAIGMTVSWLSPLPAPAATPTVLAKLCGENVKMGAAAIKSGTNTINRAPTALIMYII